MTKTTWILLVIAVAVAGVFAGIHYQKKQAEANPGGATK